MRSTRKIQLKAPHGVGAWRRHRRDLRDNRIGPRRHGHHSRTVLGRPGSRAGDDPGAVVQQDHERSRAVRRPARAREGERDLVSQLGRDGRRPRPVQGAEGDLVPELGARPGDDRGPFVVQRVETPNRELGERPQPTSARSLEQNRRGDGFTPTNRATRGSSATATRRASARPRRVESATVSASSRQRRPRRSRPRLRPRADPRHRLRDRARDDPRPPAHRHGALVTRENLRGEAARSGGPLRFLGFFRTVANRLELDSMRIEPVRREALRPVLGELGGFVQDDGVACTSPLVRLSNDRAARDQEREVMEPRLAA